MASRKCVEGCGCKKHLKSKCMSGCICGSHKSPKNAFKLGEPQPEQSERMKERWADSEWAAQQSDLVREGRKFGKKGGTEGKTWITGKPSWNRKEPIVRECARDGCEEIISTPPSLVRIRFCSNSCQARTTNVGLKHPGRQGKWQDWDGQPYDKNWPKIRKAIKNRDKCCRICNEVKSNMDVHHVCYDRKCRDWGHLVLLCRSCHITGHRRQVWPTDLVVSWDRGAL